MNEIPKFYQLIENIVNKNMSENKLTKRRNNYSETRFELNVKQLSSAFVCLEFGALVSAVVLLAEKYYLSICIHLYSMEYLPSRISLKRVLQKKLIHIF